jgi:hypothetical protein
MLMPSLRSAGGETPGGGDGGKGLRKRPRAAAGGAGSGGTDEEPGAAPSAMGGPGRRSARGNGSSAGGRATEGPRRSERGNKS